MGWFIIPRHKVKQLNEMKHSLMSRQADSSRVHLTSASVTTIGGGRTRHPLSHLMITVQRIEMFGMLELGVSDC